MVFHWSLSDSKSPQVSRTLLSILAVFNNAVVWMVSTRSPTSKSSRPFNNPLVTVPKAPITICLLFSKVVTGSFHWSLSDRKRLQIARTLRSILSISVFWYFSEPRKNNCFVVILFSSDRRLLVCLLSGRKRLLIVNLSGIPWDNINGKRSLWLHL